jgi:hypothetical protein
MLIFKLEVVTPSEVFRSLFNAVIFFFFLWFSDCIVLCFNCLINRRDNDRNYWGIVVFFNICRLILHFFTEGLVC